MNEPAVTASASRPTMTSEAARQAFRRKREAAGHSQIGLARLLGFSTAYVAHVENGRVNPSPEARAALAAALGESAPALFSGFPPSVVELRAELGARIVEEYDQGKSDAVIAELVGMSRSAVTFRRRAAGRADRPNLATFDPGPGRITAMRAANKYGLDLHALCKAIDRGIAVGRMHDVAGSHPIRTVDERELEEYLANRPECAYDGCNRRAGIVSDACSGPHARALETKGTKLAGETCRKMSAAKKGKPRPDVRVRVAQMHADLEQHYRWNVALAEGRSRISTPAAAAKMKRRAKGRLGGLLAARQRGTGAPTAQVNDEQRLKVERLADRGWGRPAICDATGLTDWVVRKLLRELRKRTV